MQAFINYGTNVIDFEKKGGGRGSDKISKKISTIINFRKTNYGKNQSSKRHTGFVRNTFV